MSDNCVELFRALADSTRQDILELLEDHEYSVNALCEEFQDMTQPTISHHLQILKRCRLVDSRRSGKLIFYSINKRVIRDGFEKFVTRFNIQIIE